MWYVRDVLYAVLFVRVRCFVVRGCSVSRRYISPVSSSNGFLEYCSDILRLDFLIPP